MKMVELKRCLFIITIISCSFQYFLCKEGVSYKFQRNACNNFNRKFVHNISCRVRHFNRTVQLFNLEAHLQPNVSLNNIRVQITSYLKFSTVYRPSLIKFSEFICEALNNRTYSHYVHAARESYAKFSNLLEPCPKSGKLYIKDMLMDTTNFPQFIPPGEYRLDIEFFTSMNGNEEFISMIQDYIEVKALGALQF